MKRVAREHVLAEMPDDPSGELEAMPLGDLLISYGTWRARLIPPQPRVCHLSRELQASPKATERKAGLDAIVAKIDAGNSLKPHLSRAVETAHQSEAESIELKRRRDRDLLVADWGLHHLHLSTTIEADGYVERADDLLFAAFTPTDAYLIGIYPHGSWGLIELLAILVRNWGENGPMHKANFVVALTRDSTEQELLDFRAAGIANPAVTIDGEVWGVPALGQTLGGTPVAATQTANRVMHALREWREDAESRLATAADTVDASAGRTVSGPWEAVVHDDCLGLEREDVFYPVIRLC